MSKQVQKAPAVHTSKQSGHQASPPPKQVRKALSIRNQLHLLSLFIVLITALLCLGATLWFFLRMEYHSLDNNLKNSAQVIAQAPGVADVLAGRGDNARLNTYLSGAIIRVQDIDVITVADQNGIIHYYPDPSYLGQAYPGVQNLPVLNGSDISVTTGNTLSDVARCAYAAVRDTDGSLLGFVAVGIRQRSLNQLIFTTVFTFAALALAAAVVSFLVSNKVSGRIKKTLMGYEPDAFLRLFHQREDILESLEEGMIAIDREARIIYVNKAAVRMLGVSSRGSAQGHLLREVYPSSQLPRLLKTGRPEYNISIQCLPGVHAISDRMPIWENGQVTGAVAFFRDRTEVTRLAEDLTGVHHMVDAMRAYTHEFMNKLHIILGYLQLGQPEKAEEYILEITQTHHQGVSRMLNQVSDVSVAALLVGKASRAAELGAHFILDPKSQLGDGEHLLPSGALDTVLGNLIDNALESLNHSTRKPKEVSVSIREKPDRLQISVEDNGPGIPKEVLPHIFERGFSTKGGERGTGLALVQELVNSYHGALRIESNHSVGTCFYLSFQATAEDHTIKEE